MRQARLRSRLTIVVRVEVDGLKVLASLAVDAVSALGGGGLWEEEKLDELGDRPSETTHGILQVSRSTREEGSHVLLASLTRGRSEATELFLRAARVTRSAKTPRGLRWTEN